MRHLRQKGFALVSIVLMLLTPIASVTAQPISPLDSTEIRANGDSGDFSTSFYLGRNGGSGTDIANGKKDKGSKKKKNQEDSNKDKGTKNGENGNNGNGEKNNKGSENENKGGEKKGEKKHRNRSSNNSSASKDPLVNATIDVDEDATALKHRKAVLSVLRDVNAQNTTSKQIERYVTTLNGTLEDVLDGDRVTSAEVFRVDKEIVAPLHKRAPQIAEHLALSDKKLARQAIDDAEQASDVLEDRNISYDETAVSENITAAREAFDRASHVRNRSMVGAIEHYRQAWTHAQRALDIMDEATAPNVTIETREDFPHNGTIESTIAGTIFDIRPHELTAEIEINGSNRTLSLTRETKPATIAEFNTTVTLATQLPNESRVYAVNVSAHDPGVDVADNGYNSEDQLDVHADQRHNDVVVLDGDGLPDVYELNVTGTDPYNPDSDAVATASNESADGVIDGAEDFDNDSLISYVESKAGTDPLDNDTDGDKLPDDFEHSWSTLDPTRADTNANGRPDSHEDPDNDSLVNLREFELGTNILSNDSDRDGLNDSTEVHQLGTNPTNVDTDDDNLTDSDELELGTDPLNPDTDQDGILDGDERYTTTATDNETNVSVQFAGQGNAAKGISIIEKPDYHNSSDVKKGPVVEISNSTSIENATVSIPYSGSVDSKDEDHLSMFKYNRTTGIWGSVNSTVDPKNGTVSATVNSTSHFAVFNETQWNELTAIEPKEGVSFENVSLECEGACTVQESVLVIGQQAESDSAGPFTDIGDDGDPDRDDDGVLNGVDNCPDTSNPDQSDSDGDGVGDACDDDETDSDNDLIPDSSDNCVNTPNQSQVDTDGDGKGDACDGDDDGDSIPDSSDNCPKKANPGQSDRDGDGLGAYCDSDEPIYEITEMEFPIPQEPETVKLDQAYNIEGVQSGYYPKLIIESEDKTLTRTLWSTDWNVETVDVTEFKGQTITVSVNVPEQTTVRLKPPAVIKDTDGDGIYDYLEKKESYYPGLEGGTVKTNPERSDTDDEGLNDGQEITYELVSPDDYGGAGSDPLVREIVKVGARPDTADTDFDKVTDYQELQMWGSSAQDSDTDRDGFQDSYDGRPTIVDEPPTIKDIESSNFKDYVELTIDGASPLSVAAKPKYDPDSPKDDAFWNSSMASVERLSDSKYRIEFDRYGWLDEPPEKYWVNVTDPQGNVRTVLIDVQENGGAEVAKAGVTVGAVASLPSPDPVPEEVLRVPIGGLILGISSAVLVAENEYRSSDGEVLEQKSMTVVEEEYPASETKLDIDVTLPAGTVGSEYNTLTGQENYVGHGWRYISTTTEISKTEIKHTLNNPVTIHENGDVLRIIGKSSTGDEFVLTIIGGVLLAASRHPPVYNEDCEDIIEIDWGDRPEHALRDEKPVNDVSTLKEALKNPSLIIEAGGQRFYILKIGTNEVVMFVTTIAEAGYYILETQLTGKENGFFKSIKEAVDKTPEKDRKTIDPKKDC